MKTAKYTAGLLAGLIAGTALANAEQININEADAKSLEALTGVGPATAAAIIEERESGGPFESVEALTRVRGIGEATLEEMREQISLE